MLNPSSPQLRHTDTQRHQDEHSLKRNVKTREECMWKKEVERTCEHVLLPREKLVKPYTSIISPFSVKLKNVQKLGS